LISFVSDGPKFSSMESLSYSLLHLKMALNGGPSEGLQIYRFNPLKPDFPTCFFGAILSTDVN
jgi:hypothetical protein